MYRIQRKPLQHLRFPTASQTISIAGIHQPTCRWLTEGGADLKHAVPRQWFQQPIGPLPVVTVTNNACIEFKVFYSKTFKLFLIQIETRNELKCKNQYITTDLDFELSVRQLSVNLAPVFQVPLFKVQYRFNC